MRELRKLNTYRLANHWVAGQAYASCIDGCGHSDVEAHIQ